VFRTTFKNLLAHRLRLLTTAAAVILGVAFMAGTLVLTDTITETFNGLFANVYKGTDAVVRGTSLFDGPRGAGAQRPRVDASLVDAVRAVKGAAVAEGTVFGFARLIGSDGQALGKPGQAPTLGVNWSETKALNPFTLFAGRAPRADNEIVIDRKSAIDGHLAVGETATVLVDGPPQRLLITGIVRFGTANSPGGASVVAFPTAVAQRLVAEPGKFDAISLVAKTDVSQQQLVRDLRAVIPHGTEAVTGATVTQEQQTAANKAMSAFSTFMLFFAVVALLVGGFMIFNTFSITVAQRMRENGLLRALGASRRQVFSSVALEALGVGLIASVLGLALGVLVAVGLKALLGALGVDIPAAGIVFAGRTAVVALVAGTSVTVVAAAVPAWKAAKVQPIAAMQNVVPTGTRYGSKTRVFVGTGMLALGLAALFYGLYGGLKSPVTIVGTGTLLMFFAVTVLGRTISLPLSRTIGWPLTILRGFPGALARDNAMRNPKRTAATASALMICVGLVGMITIFASSATASISALVDRSFTGDFTISAGGGTAGGIDPGLAQRLNQLPEVSSATAVRLGSAEVNGKAIQVGALDPKTAFGILDVKPLQGSGNDLGRDAIAVYKTVASDNNLNIGDRVPVVFKDTGPTSLRVALIYGANQSVGDYFLGLSAYEANFTNQYDAYVFLKKATGVTAASALGAIKAVAKDYPGANVLDRAQFKQETTKPIGQLLGIVYALLALAIIIALLGIGNTLALSIFERTRELGLLRAVGMTRRQLRTTIRWESVIIAVQGTTLGLLIGAIFGWALVGAMKNQGIDVFSMPYSTLTIVVVLAALAGVAAAVLPGRRAARLNVLRAVVGD
jgi:putative ABC transport system permease protein